MALGIFSTSQQTLLLLRQVLQEIRNMSETLSNALSALQVSVTNLTTVDQSATALIQGFSARLDAATQNAANLGATQQQLQALADLRNTIDSQTAGLAAAVQANTVAAAGPSAVTPPAGPAPEQPAAPVGAPGDTTPAVPPAVPPGA